MTGAIPTGVNIAPRGKAFKVFTWTLVAGKRLAVLQPGNFVTRDDADALASRLGVPDNVLLIDLTVQVES